MDESISSDLHNYVKTFLKTEEAGPLEIPKKNVHVKLPLQNAVEREPLTTKDAVKYLLDGTLKSKVCRYCLNVTSQLSELDKILQLANMGSLYHVTIKDMVANFYPFKVEDDPNFPDKICEKCLDRTISSYLFTQQCEQAERALRNCFEDVYEKLDKLDPIEQPKKRGRQKLKPNYNIIHAEHENVINYADPLIHIVNIGSQSLTKQTAINELECLKCCEVLPNLESLINHTKKHPKSMWYNCRLCGTSFPKHSHLKKHLRLKHAPITPPLNEEKQVTTFDCKECGVVTENYNEHLQHIEKHTFKMVMEHLVEGKMDRLCSICHNKGNDMVPLSKTICLHGGCPGLTGDRPLCHILASTLPEMNILDNYTGTKICQKCLSHAITSYVFTNQTYFVRNRLNICISAMLENLNTMAEPSNNICIEIGQNAVMNVSESLLVDEGDIDEEQSKPEVLEDEFRINSEDDSDTENEINEIKQERFDISNDKNLTAHSKSSLLNGYKIDKADHNEFTAFKKKRKVIIKAKFTCPLCNKYFVSDYFLKRHVLKHVPRNAVCNICNLKFKSKFDMYEHKKMNHTLSKSIYLSCKVCGRCYLNEEKLKYHVKHHINPLCQLCDKQFKSQSSYNSHMRRHLRKLGLIMKKYTQNCSFCEKNCPNDNEFSLHVNKVHLQIKPYICDMCDRHFYTEYNLTSHKKLHSIHNKEQCNFCNKFLISRKQLVIHIRKHIGDMPFHCQICNQTFYSECGLKKHMKMYHGGSYCCKLCKTAYLTKKILIEHVNKVHNIY